MEDKKPPQSDADSFAKDYSNLKLVDSIYKTEKITDDSQTSFGNKKPQNPTKPNNIKRKTQDDENFENDPWNFD